MANLEEYVKSVKPSRKSKLEQYNNEISTLRESGYSVKQIHNFLTEYEKIDINLDYLFRYIQKLNTKELVKEIPSNPKSEPKQEEKKEDQEEVKKEEEKPKVDPIAAYKKLKEENAKNGTSGNKVGYWEAKNSRVRDWGKNNK